MKEIFAFGILFFSVHAFSQETLKSHSQNSEASTELESESRQTSDGKDGVSNLSFSLPEGKTYIGFGYMNYMSKSSLMYAGGVVSDVSSTASAFGAHAIYGLTDNFEVVISAILMGTQTLEYKYGPASTLNGRTQTIKNDAPSNPVFGFRYQILSQDNLNAFGSLLYTSSLIKAKSGTVNSNGTLANPQASSEIEFNVVKTIGEVELAAKLTRVQYNSGNSENAETAVESSYTGFHKTSVSGEFRKHNLSNFYWGAKIMMENNEAGSVESRGSTTDYDQYNTTEYSLTAGYNLTPTMTIVANYIGGLAYSSKVTLGTTRLDYSKEQQNNLGITFGILF